MLPGFSIAQKGMKRPKALENEIDSEVVYREGWVLAIGINKYSELSSQYQLRYAVKDAESFVETLQSRFGFSRKNITILKDEEATKARIEKELNNLADHNRVQKDDCVIVYFSGHGVTASLPRGGDTGFIVPSDAKLDLSEEPNLGVYKQYCIEMNQLKKDADAIAAKHIIFIMDACYGGLALTGTRGLGSNVPGFYRKVAKSVTQQMITAGGKDEEAMEVPELGHGVFTYKLLEALQNNLADSNNDNVITGTELAMYLGNAVQQRTNGKQNPQFRREDEGEFLFIPQIRTGTLMIQVDPADATVTVLSDDGTRMVPSGMELELTEGSYEVVAEKSGYETATADKVKISGNAPARVSLSLKPKTIQPAKIIINDLPGDAKVFINDSSVKLPYTIAPGDYRIRIERDGYEAFETSETLRSSQVFSPKITWVPEESAEGILAIQISPQKPKFQ